jgi:hypothetical protein
MAQGSVAKRGYGGGANSAANGTLFNSVNLARALRRYDRAPFLDLLQAWLENGPDIADVKLFAAKYPDRWAQTARQLAQMAGYAERTEIEHNITLNVRSMSDSQLEDQLRKELELVANPPASESEQSAEGASAVQEDGTADKEMGAEAPEFGAKHRD